MTFNLTWLVWLRGGHSPKDKNMSVAATQPGVSINDLTGAVRVDTLTGNAALIGTPIAVSVVS
jgi:hypothetical protein